MCIKSFREGSYKPYLPPPPPPPPAPAPTSFKPAVIRTEGTSDGIHKLTTNTLTSVENPSCIDDKIWCRFGDCALKNVKQRCKKSCNAC